MANQMLLTTLDNPFNPFTQFDEWYQYDTSHGYHTCAYLARVTKSSELDEDLAIDHAMDEIVSINLLGNYIKVSESYIPRIVDTEK